MARELPIEESKPVTAEDLRHLKSQARDILERLTEILPDEDGDARPG